MLKNNIILIYILKCNIYYTFKKTLIKNKIINYWLKKTKTFYKITVDT